MPSVTQQDSAEERLAFHATTASDVLRRLGSDAEIGLREEIIPTLRQRYGRNELAAPQSTPIWKKLVAQFQELVIWILIVASVIAGLLGEWVDTIAILAIVVLNGVLGFFQEEKAGRALAALRAMSTPMAKVRRSGRTRNVQASELVPGDLIELEAGDQAPADARLVESFHVSVQEASLTGESVPVEKNASRIFSIETPLADRQNLVFMGTTLSAGKGRAIVTSTGMQTELGKIAGMLESSPPETTPLQRRLGELGRILVVVCLLLVGIIFSIQYARGGALLETLLIAVSLAVAAVPEGLPAVVTIALALGLQRMVKQNALIRRLPSVETLGSVTVICTDKTGTLTRNEMTVREIHVGDGDWKVTGSGYEPDGQFLRIVPTDPDPSSASVRSANAESDIASHDLRMALTIAAHCNAAHVVRGKGDQNWEVVGDPTEGALIVAAMKGGVDTSRSHREVIDEIPFDSDRKTMSIIVRNAHLPVAAVVDKGRGFAMNEDLLGDGEAIMFTKGATENVLQQCSHELKGGNVFPLTKERRTELHEQSTAMANRALRVLSFAYRTDPLCVDNEYQERELIYAGVAGMMDPPREEVRAAIAECRRAGIRTVMITGDHPATALAIGRELHMARDDSRVVTGRELDAMNEAELLEAVDGITVFARISASHKLQIVNAWKQRGEVVAMTGDGVNDAPAVKAADIGIAMGITGTDVTREAADMVLTDDNFMSIVNAVREGRGIFHNIQKFVHYLLACNAGEVMLMFVAAVLGMPLPLVAIQILWINLVTDGLPALALAMEPPERGIMQCPPRPPREPVITWQRGLLMIYHGALIAASAFLGFWWVLEREPSNTALARTVAFAITASSQLAFALVCRSQRQTLPQLGLFSNRWLFVAFAVSGVLQLGVLTLPFAQSLFDVVPMPAYVWWPVIGLSLLPATLIEMAKIAYAVGSSVSSSGKSPRRSP